MTPWRFEKNAPTQNLFSLYLERISKQISCHQTCPRSPPADKQSATQFLVRELEKLNTPGTAVVCLDENGKTMSSQKFSDFLGALEGKGIKQTIFCVGGAYGLPSEISEIVENAHMISLSAMTFPHEMALAMLAEQVYRARTIMGGHPYHHADASELFQSQR